MGAQGESAIATSALLQPPSGEWRVLSARNLRRVEGLYGMVEEFEPLDHPAGHEAARFLKDDALGNPGVVTRVLVGEDRIEGFITTSYTTVQLAKRDKLRLGLRRLDTPVPAFHLLWVCKHRLTTVSGLELVGAAYGLGLEAAEAGGLPLFVLDPADAEVEAIWKGEPYFFEESDTPPRKSGVPRKLWTTLG